MTKEQKKIFVVDDALTSLTACKNVLKPYYEVFPAPTAAKMFELLSHVKPDIILLDVDMPDINGYEAAGMLKRDEATKDIPIIFLSGRVDPKSEIFGLNMGALDYIHKPFVSELLLKRIETHLSLIEHQKMLEEQNKSILTMRTPLNEIINLLDYAIANEDPVKSREYAEKAKNGALNFLNIFAK